MLTPSQSRAARALINWSQHELAVASGVSVSTIRDFETGKRAPIPANIAALARALETAGCIFIAENGEGPGVRLRKAPPAIATQIEVLEEKIATIPDADEPSPEGAMNVMRKAVAENDLANLKGRQPRPKRK